MQQNLELKSVLMTNQWKNDEYRLKMTNYSINRWHDTEWVDNQFKNRVAYKDFMLPSGKIVKIQGYEPQVLTKLLTEYKENDIIIGVKAINKEIGKILYDYEGNSHSYYPDFYIKSIHTIIEVKSHWTYNLHLEKNHAKQKACVAAGFNFKFEIL